MSVEVCMRRIAYLAVLAAMAAGLAGCDSLSEAAGLTKSPPDEFAVATKAPLIIPPDYNLKPPRAGAEPTNQVSPSESAADTLYGTQKVTAANGTLSTSEVELLTKAGASNSNNLIRQRIAADNRAMQASDDSFTNELLFGMGSDHSGGTPVDADAEKKRLDKSRANGGTAPGPVKPADGSTTIQKDSGGWLDDIFGGIF
jgi:Protein of unknown function (DUF3035)